MTARVWAQCGSDNPSSCSHNLSRCGILNFAELRACYCCKKEVPLVPDTSSIKKTLMDEKFVSDDCDSFLLLTPCGANECLDYVDAGEVRALGLE